MLSTTLVEHVAEMSSLSERIEAMNGNNSQQQTLCANLTQQVKMALPILRQLITPLETTDPTQAS